MFEWFKKYPEPLSVEEFYAGCNNDAVVMIDRALENWSTITWTHFFYLQKHILIDMRKVLKEKRDD